MRYINAIPAPTRFLRLVPKCRLNVANTGRMLERDSVSRKIFLSSARTNLPPLYRPQCAILREYARKVPENRQKSARYRSISIKTGQKRAKHTAGAKSRSSTRRSTTWRYRLSSSTAKQSTLNSKLGSAAERLLHESVPQSKASPNTAQIQQVYHNKFHK